MLLKIDTCFYIALPLIYSISQKNKIKPLKNIIDSTTIVIMVCCHKIYSLCAWKNAWSTFYSLFKGNK